MTPTPSSFATNLLGQLAGDALRELVEVSDVCITARAPPGWRAVAERLSRGLGGQWWPKPKGCTWLLGRQVRWMMEPEQLPDVLAARKVCADLGVEAAWSVGGCARRLLRFVGPAQIREASRERLLNQISLGYHECQPGEHPYARLWDVSGCYFNLLSRLPCLRLTVRHDHIIWHRWDESEGERWRDLLGEAARVKLLRNALWGCAIGRVEAGSCFIRGVERQIKGAGGPFRASGLLVGRSAWELCREASIETASVYSQTDCVVTPRNVAPTSWACVGLETVVQASGPADIRARGIYRVGDKSTHWYREGSRLTEAAERPAEPRDCWYPRWL